MYVAVKGGEKAIANAHELLWKYRRGEESVPELSLEQILGQLYLSVSRVMAEGSLYAPRLAALAIKQAWGDLVEATFLLRAARTSYPSFGYSLPLDSSSMRVKRRVSGVWKDLPGGQILGPTFDYTHRILDHDLAGQNHDLAGQGSVSKEGVLGKEKDEKEKLNANNGEKEHDPDSFAALTSKLRQGKDSESLASEPRGNSDTAPQSSSSLPFEESLGKVPRAARILTDEGLMEKAEDQGTTPKDLTLGALSFPAGRDLRLQSLARADEGFVLSLAYSSQRGFGSTHPFVTDLRLGKVKVEFIPPELGFPVTLGEIELTECETVNQFVGNEENPPVFTRGYGLVFGFNERKAISMAIVERSLRSDLKEAEKGPAQNEEFVLAHGDNVEAAGFVSHVKLPHYVDFQAELGLVRDMRKKHDSFRKEREEAREETRKEAREEAPLGAPPREIRTP